MRVRCTATADYRSNALGSLELECTDAGLSVALRGVSAYREGYAPGPPVHAPPVLVPWPSVYATRIGEESLLLSVDARRLPLNRLMLGQFADPPLETTSGLSPARRLAFASLLAAGLLAIGVMLGLSGALPQPRALGTFGMAAAVAAGVLAIILLRDQRAPRRSSSEVLRDLSLELARRLPNHIAMELPTPQPRAFRAVALSSLLPRSAVGVAITLAATTLAALVGSSAARPSPGAIAPTSSAAALRPEPFDSEPPASRPLDGVLGASWREATGQAPIGLASPGLAPASLAPAGLAPAGLAPAGLASAGLASAEPAPSEPEVPGGARSEPPASVEPSLGEPCECQRDESLLWREPLPRLAPVIISRQTRVHDGHTHTELELALINDGADAVERLHLSVVFYEERAGTNAGQWQTGERSLDVENALAPGHLRVWHVEGRGTSFDVVGPELAPLAPDASDAAPPDAFAALAGDGPRAVRLHAARLLAFLGDERAQAAALALRPTASRGELAYLDRVVGKPHEVLACRLSISRASASSWRVAACLFNRTRQPQAELGVRLRALDDTIDVTQPGARSPVVLAEHGVRLPAPLPAGAGRVFTVSARLPLEPGVVPRAFELAVDREENLP